MQIANDSVVSIEYTLTDDAGKVLDASAGRGPLQYIHGRQEIVPGLEKALTGRRDGDRVAVSISPADGYGEYDESRTVEVPRSQLPPSLEPRKGMQLMMGAPGGGQVPVTVTKVKVDSVVIDQNHPLAGKSLHFDVEVKGVRKARQDELVSDCCSSGTCGS